MENRELVEAIRGMLKEELEPIHKEIGKMKDRPTVLEVKKRATHKKLDNLALDMKTVERDTRRDIAQANDAAGALIAVLEAKGILPKAL